MIAAFLLLLSSVLLGFGLLRLFVWCLDYRDSRIDADYRAARLVALARAEVRRG